MTYKTKPFFLNIGLGLLSFGVLSFVTFIPKNITLAADISFEPTGSQLDADPILDINVESGSTISFDISLDTSGIASGDDHLILLTWDTSELGFINLSDDTSQFTNTGSLTVCLPDSFCSIDIFETLPDQSGDLASIDFNVLNPKNDGDSDFTASLFRSVFLEDDELLDRQIVEVQTSEPLSILGLITVCGIALGTSKKKTKELS